MCFSFSFFYLCVSLWKQRCCLRHFHGPLSWSGIKSHLSDYCLSNESFIWPSRHSVYSFHRPQITHPISQTNMSQKCCKEKSGEEMLNILSWKEGEYMFNKSWIKKIYIRVQTGYDLSLEPMPEARMCTKQSCSSDSSVMNALVKWYHLNSLKWFYSCWDGKNFIHGIHWKGASIFCSFLYSSQTIPLFTMISIQTKRLTIIAEATRIMAKVKHITGILFCPTCSCKFIIMLIGNKAGTGTQLEALFWSEDMVHMDTYREV